MNVVAFYRILYGQDFLADSIRSVLAHPAVSQVVLFMARKPFGGAEHVNYFGRRVYFPERIDNVRDVADTMAREYFLNYGTYQHSEQTHPALRLRLVESPFGEILPGQGRVMLEWIKERYPAATHAMMVEPDEVWRRDCLDRLLATAGDQVECGAHVRLYWRSPRFMTRRTEPITVLRRLDVPVQDTGFHLSSGMPIHPEGGVEVHNYGYAASARTVFWKHLCALSFSRDKGIDSAPRENWFENDWLPWSFSHNRHGRLCPSVGAEGHWPVPVIDEMPQPALTAKLPEWETCQ